jgi:heat-inducible transcriptional repressor
MGVDGPSAPHLERHPPITARQAEVLRCIVRDHVQHGGSVSSAAVAAELSRSVSSATVRVEMAVLEQLGLLGQPHASAGRTPTAAGIRFYVDRLMHTRPPSPQARGDLSAALEEAEPDALLRIASRYLASRCTLTTLGRKPRLDDGVVERLELVSLSSERVLAVLVLADGAVRHRTLNVQCPIEMADRARALFAERFAGWSLGRIREALRAELAADGHGPTAPLLALAARALPAAESADDAVIVEGRTHLLDRTESGMTGLMRTLEEKRVLLQVLDGLDSAAGREAARVVLGEETGLPPLRGLALVTALFGAPGQPPGMLAVIGPVRMDYARVVPWVSFTAGALSGRLCAEGVA